MKWLLLSLPPIGVKSSSLSLIKRGIRTAIVFYLFKVSAVCLSP